MGFYAPSQIVQDARRHDIDVFPIDVQRSDWDNTLITREEEPPAIQLGLRQVRGFSEEASRRIMASRAQCPFADIADLCARAAVDKRHQDLLAQASALRGLSRHRHHAHWEIAGVEKQLPLFGNVSPAEIEVALPTPTQAEDTLADYARTGLTLGVHPMAQIRDRLRAARCTDSRTLRKRPHNSYARVAGVVTMRQRPQTASGVTFLTMEDEHGMINVVVWRDVAETHRRVLLESELLGIDGRWEAVDGVCHLIASRVLDMSELLGGLDVRSRDFH